MKDIYIRFTLNSYFIIMTAHYGFIIQLCVFGYVFQYRSKRYAQHKKRFSIYKSVYKLKSASTYIFKKYD